MRLKKLKVSGFKSFVDPTDIRLPADLVGVVGPNGCGKSNVIDAVRWVMGESSAKMLRGDNMADVIFNGSSSRKPVGKASVELVFDNSAGSVTGNYAQFAELSIKRTLSRDGTSTYYINKIKTRRRDVLDLFRGTGLGPRSYSIIEQGMVSRIVEARPDELRAFVEEAAGTSRYKDRRRETELRIKHTRENLDRVQDIIGELDKQLRRLQRQSNSARRYKVLKEEERILSGQCQLLRLQELDTQVENQDRDSAKFENNLQSAIARQREVETQIEKTREEQVGAQDSSNEIQREFYGLGAEIKNIEQRIVHLKESRQQQDQEISRLESSVNERQQQLTTDQSRLKQLETDRTALIPELASTNSSKEKFEKELEASEVKLQNWLQNWERFNNQSQVPVQQQEVQKSKIGQLQRHIEQSRERFKRIESELESSLQSIKELDLDSLRSSVTEHDRKCEESENAYQSAETEIQALRVQLQQKRSEVAVLRARQHESSSRLQSLKEIQQAALGGDNDALQSWLSENQLDQQPKLATRIKVKDGWERAADRLLNGFLGSICIDTIHSSALEQSPDCSFSLVTTSSRQDTISISNQPLLLDKIEADDVDLAPFLESVFIAENREQALALQPELKNRECVVTRDGCLIGANWVSFSSRSQLDTGVLVREEEIKQLESKILTLEQEIDSVDTDITKIDIRRIEKESQLNVIREELNRLRADKTKLHNQLGGEEARVLELEQQRTRQKEELTELEKQISSDESELEVSKRLLLSAEEKSESLSALKNEMIAERDQIQGEVARKRQGLKMIRETQHEKALQKQRMDAAIESLNESLNRLQAQYDTTINRLTELKNKPDTERDSVQELKQKLEGMLAAHVEVEKRLNESSDVLSSFDNKLSTCVEERNQCMNAVNSARDAYENQKMSRQEIVVRRNTMQEQMEEQGYSPADLVSELPEEANIDEWQRKLNELTQKIDRIGPVNLVAIEEYDEEKERKVYLDKQHEDLSEALETLENVIRKIDRETRTKFRETFDQLNAGFNEFFPQLFGGGKADLLLTSEDLLTTGVTVMARPPGKRNSTIHLLSGGEKALTAVALLFSLFKLNPAPFCMLDEVDAPLDDANVDRYCKVLRTLSEVSQIIVITHNKITMESAQVLVGVTMAEPGVSRLVSVDIDEAVKMAAQ